MTQTHINALPLHEKEQESAMPHQSDWQSAEPSSQQLNVGDAA